MLDYFKTNDSHKTSEQEYYIKIGVYTFPDVIQRPGSSIKHEHIYIYIYLTLPVCTYLLLLLILITCYLLHAKGV